MTPYEERIFARYDQVPRDIMERAMHDVFIHAALQQWVDTDRSVEDLLVRLVLLLSEQAQNQIEEKVNYYRTGYTSGYTALQSDP